MRAFGVLLLSGWSVPALAQQSASSGASEGRARATVAQPVRATAIEDLSFGTLAVSGAQGGFVTIPEDGSAPELSGDIVSVCTGVSSCVAHPASFAVSGESGRRYGVSLPSGILLSGKLSGSQLRVESMTMRSRNAASLARSGNLGPDGKDIFTIGGTLNVPTNSKPDQYDGELTVTVSYF